MQPNCSKMHEMSLVESSRRRIDFGSTEIGQMSPPETIELTNRSEYHVKIELDGNPPSESKSFHFDIEASIDCVPPSKAATIAVRCSPRKFGPCRYDLVVRTTSPTDTELVTVQLCGTGTPPQRLSIREIALPKAQGGAHFVVSVGQQVFYQALTRWGEDVDWYTIVSTRTSRQSVGPSTNLKAGEVYIDSSEALLEHPAILQAFDIHEASPNWLTRKHGVLARQVTATEIGHAMGHIFGSCKFRLPACRHLPVPLSRLFVRHVSQAPAQGAVLEVPYGAGVIFAIVISTREVTALRSTCLGMGKEQYAVVVLADQGEPDDSATLFGVPIAPTSGYPRLYALCYRPLLQNIANARNTQHCITASEFEQVVDRVSNYLGAE